MFTHTQSTYHYQRRKIYPRPERLGILNIIHYIYPALEADHLSTHHIRAWPVVVKTQWHKFAKESSEKYERKKTFGKQTFAGKS